MRGILKARREWEKYWAGVPGISPECGSFDTVYHICHIRDAFRMFEDGKIRSSLVWDESRLRNTRTCVSWVSPNLWSYGSIYGNIRFEFAWGDQVEGKQLFWIEDVPRYNPPAYRILASGEDFGTQGLDRYDPTKDKGPVLYDEKTGVWYRNTRYTGELLIDGDLLLEECTRVGFDHHNPDICRRSRKACPDIRKNASQAGGELIARLAGHNLTRHTELFLDAAKKRRELHTEVMSAWKRLEKALSVQKGSDGRLRAKDPAA